MIAITTGVVESWRSLLIGDSNGFILTGNKDDCCRRISKSDLNTRRYPRQRCGQAWSKGCYGDVVDLGLDHASCRPCLLWLSYPKNWNGVMLSSWLDFVASASSCTKGLISR